MTKRIPAFSLAIVLLCGSIAAFAADFAVQTRYPVIGDDGWDYITVDSAARRLYVSHGVRVNVLDADTGKQVGVIEDTPGVHGIAVAGKAKHGFTSNGKEDKVTMFDTGSLAVIKKIDVGKGPDGIYFHGETQRIFTNNHKSHDITAIDAATGDVIGTVKVNGDGEGAAAGANGLIYVALEDKDEVAVFDAKTLEVKQHFKLETVKAPTGLALDAKNGRIFVGGHNKTMVVLDAATGKQIATFPTGSGTDAAGYDAKNGLIFLSNGEGNITVIQQNGPDTYAALTPISTQAGAKTMAFDKKTGKIFLPTATVEIKPAADPAEKPTKTIVSGTFCVLVVGK